VWPSVAAASLVYLADPMRKRKPQAPFTLLSHAGGATQKLGACPLDHAQGLFWREASRHVDKGENGLVVTARETMAIVSRAFFSPFLANQLSQHLLSRNRE